MGYTASRILVWAVVGAMVFALVPAGQLAATGNEQDCNVHEPIRLLEDKGANGFVWDDPITGEEVYRPGSGVVAGDGTASEPYVIEGWCISGADWDPPWIGLPTCGFDGDGPNPESTGIIVCGTTEHFVVRNTTVNLWEHGTALGNISRDTGAIEHTSHENNTFQLHVDTAPDLVVRENVVHGIDTTEKSPDLRSGRIWRPEATVRSPQRQARPGAPDLATRPPHTPGFSPQSSLCICME